MLRVPDGFWDHLKRYTTSIGATVTYGHRIPILDTPRVKMLYSVSSDPPDLEDSDLDQCAMQWLNRFSLLQERSQLADWYPALKPLFLRLPAWVSGFLREATELRDMEWDMWIQLIKGALGLIQEGKMHPSQYFSKSHVQRPSNRGLTKTNARFQSRHAVNPRRRCEGC